MENYRQSLVKILQETPKEQRGAVLNEARNTEEFKKVEQKHKDEKMLFSEQSKLLERYKEIVSNIKVEVTKKVAEYGYDDDPITFDALVLSSLYHKFREDNIDLTSTLALMRKFPNPGLIDEANLAQDGVYTDDSETLNSSKELLVHRSVFSEETKNVLLTKILENTNGNSVLNKIEALSYIGITPSVLDKIKKSILESGDMVLVEKLYDDFSLSLTNEELLTLSEKAYEKESLYDLVKIIEKLPNPDVKIIEKKNQLLEKAELNFSLNKQKIVDGVQNKDMLLHFSKRKNLSSILSNGILPIQEQKNILGIVETGEGADMQEILGRHDCVSVFNFYKGANGENDQKLYNEMKLKISSLIGDFQRDYPERVFLLGGYGTRSVDEIHISREDKEKYISKFSKSIYVSNTYNYYIDPTDTANLTNLNVLVCKNGSDDCYIEKRRNGQPIFTELFFENLDDKKQKLLDDIKKKMKDAYDVSISSKDFSEINSERLNIALGGDYDESNNNRKFDDNSRFILDPNLSKTFVMSMYFNESFVDEKITPDKIIGLKLTDKYTEKECFNSGKVGFSVLAHPKEESLENKEILFSDGDIFVYANNPYKA